MPSVRVDSTRLIAGACVVSAYPGHGIRGGDVPSTGEHAPPILYAGLSLPAEANDEFRVLILTRPGTLPGLVIREDSSVEVPEGSPVGTHSGTWRGYKNGAIFAPDPQTFEIVIGPSEISGDAAVDEPGAGGGMASAAELSGDAAIDEPTAGGGAESAAQISGDAAIDEPGAGGGMSSAGTSAITGDATIDEPTAAGGAESAAEVSGDAAIDEPGAGGGMSSAGTSAITGDAQVDEPGAGGGMESAAQLSGDAQVDEPGAGGGMESLPNSSVTGDAQIDEPGAGGGMEGAAEVGGNAQIDEPFAGGGMASIPPGGLVTVPPRALLQESGSTRIVRAGRKTPTWLTALDVSEVDDIYFDFLPVLGSPIDPIVSVECTCEARVGTDPAAAAMRVSPAVASADAAVQRIRAGVVGVTYLLRCQATLASGRSPVAAAFMKVVRKL